MIVSPETSQLADRSQWVPISANALAPVINSRLADTVVVVPDGQTVIIGGLMETHVLESESKIPWLGDIPWVGAALRHKQKSKVKTELMIFLTPHVVAAPTELAAMSAHERENAILKPKAISETELDHFIDRLPTKDINAPVAPQKPKKK